MIVLTNNCYPSFSGDYVLTCMADGGKALHFKLNKVTIEEDTWYQFEGEAFQSVLELIDHHLMNNVPISNTSKATIHRPIIAKADLNAAKVNPDRSQSSMSGDTTASTASSGTSTQLTKSGSRASLLKVIWHERLNEIPNRKVIKQLAIRN